MTSGWGAEARKSGGLVTRESRLFAGLLVALLGYAGWVLLTGYIVESSAPARALLTVRGAAVSAPVVGLTVAWLGLPAVLAPVLVDRYLRNRAGNRPPNPYRLVAHPILLLWPPGIAVAVAFGLLATAGARLPAVAAATVTALYLVVRTVAYGYRVYTFSRPLVLWAVTGLAAASALGGLLTAAATDPVAGAWLPLGLGRTVSTWQSIAGGRSLALAGPVAAVALAGGYVLVQAAVSVVTRLRTPIDDPDKRSGQRYPRGAAPVATSDTPTDGADDSADDSQTRVFQGGGPTGVGGPESQATGASGPVGNSGTDGSGAAADAERPDDRSRLATPDTERGGPASTPEPSTASGDDSSSAPSGDPAEEANDWEADTAVFTPDDTDGSDRHVCGDCGAQLADETARFCPNCGAQIRG